MSTKKQTDLCAQLTQSIDRAIGAHMIPGIGIVWGSGEGTHELFRGRLTYDSSSPNVAQNTIYDVASITKLFTAAAVLKHITLHTLALDTSIGEVLQSSALKDVTVLHALSHTSCLNVPFSQYKDHPDELRQIVLQSPPIAKPGTHYYYANINYYLLGRVLEELLGSSIDLILKESLFEPLDMTTTCFNPDKALAHRIAPTEIDSWRNMTVKGIVHDESAFAFGGVTGYAGAFSVVHDLFKFGLLYLNRGKVNSEHFIDCSLIDNSLKVAFPDAPEAPKFTCKHGFSGFRIADRKRIGSLASEHTCEFSGFTGPAIYIDPDRHLLAAFVDNRTYPHRPKDFSPLIKMRAELFELICESYPLDKD